VLARRGERRRIGVSRREARGVARIPGLANTELENRGERCSLADRLDGRGLLALASRLALS